VILVAALRARRGQTAVTNREQSAVVLFSPQNRQIFMLLIEHGWLCYVMRFVFQLS